MIVDPSFNVILYHLSFLVVCNSIGKYLSRLMGKPTICICENKDADQLRGNREADQRLCFRYSDSTISPLLYSKIQSFYLFSVTVQAGLCLTCSETTLLVFPRGGSFVISFPLGIWVSIVMQMYVYHNSWSFCIWFGWLGRLSIHGYKINFTLRMCFYVGKSELFFVFFYQNIDCGYTLETPRVPSNLCFRTKIRKIGKPRIHQFFSKSGV